MTGHIQRSELPAGFNRSGAPSPARNPQKMGLAKIGFVFFAKYKQTHILLALNARKSMFALFSSIAAP
ncbi:MAG: hypothetical protein ABSG65_17615 [Bryobacteraceae bacterium]|jgi:hypothetical protein